MGPPPGAPPGAPTGAPRGPPVGMAPPGMAPHGAPPSQPPPSQYAQLLRTLSQNFAPLEPTPEALAVDEFSGLYDMTCSLEFGAIGAVILHDRRERPARARACGRT